MLYISTIMLNYHCQNFAFFWDGSCEVSPLSNAFSCFKGDFLKYENKVPFIGFSCFCVLKRKKKYCIKFYSSNNKHFIQSQLPAVYCYQFSLHAGSHVGVLPDHSFSGHSHLHYTINSCLWKKLLNTLLQSCSIAVGTLLLLLPKAWPKCELYL